MQCYCLATRPPRLAASSVALPTAATVSMPLAPRARELSAVLDLFPAVRHAFAYGSGVFVQPGLYDAESKAQKPMLDFIFAVDSPEEWHQQVRSLWRKHCAAELQSLFVKNCMAACLCFQNKFSTTVAVLLQNITQNSHHYSSLSWLGSGAVSFILLSSNPHS